MKITKQAKVTFLSCCRIKHKYVPNILGTTLTNGYSLLCNYLRHFLAKPLLWLKKTSLGLVGRGTHLAPRAG
jgi:hypothetical protein